MTLRGKFVPEILEVDVHVYLHGVEILAPPELPLRQGQPQLPLRAVPVDGGEGLHVPSLHQVRPVSGPEVDGQPAHPGPGGLGQVQEVFVPGPGALGPGQVSGGARSPGTPQEDSSSNITETGQAISHSSMWLYSLQRINWTLKRIFRGESEILIYRIGKYSSFLVALLGGIFEMS